MVLHCCTQSRNFPSDLHRCVIELSLPTCHATPPLPGFLMYLLSRGAAETSRCTTNIKDKNWCEGYSGHIQDWTSEGYSHWTDALASKKYHTGDSTRSWNKDAGQKYLRENRAMLKVNGNGCDPRRTYSQISS